MKRLLCLGMLSVTGVGGAAVLPIFINVSPLVLPDAGLPTVNTVAFVNQSSITVSPFTISVGVGVGGFGFNSAATLPFETFNTLYYTNEATGVMSGSPGFRFLTTQTGIRRPAKWFVNEGEITTGTYLEVRADNMVSTGPLDTSQFGLIRLTGKSADLTRTRLRSGPFAETLLGISVLTDYPRRQFVNDVGVTDAYWGVGTNGAFQGSGPATRLNAFNLNLPDPTSPVHRNEYFLGRRLATNAVNLPKDGFSGFLLTNFAAFVYNSTVDGTADLVQVVFVRTNGPNANFSANVTFAPFSTLPAQEVPGPAQPMVELKTWSFDPSLDLHITNAFYLADSMAILTNLTLFRNTGVGARGSRRPNVYEFQLSPTFNWYRGVPANSIFTNGMLDTGFVTNRVNMAYAGYSAVVFTNALSSLNNFSFLPGTIVPTNQAGRVEVVADQLNLDSTRLRAESTLLVRTKDLLGNRLARLMDAPLVGVDVTSKQPELIISNIAPATVERLSGTVCAWSGYWRNQKFDPVTMTTNEIHFHVLFVDHSLQPTVPVQVFQFAAHATNLIIADNLNLYPSSQSGFFFGSDPIRGRKFLIDAPSLDVRGGLNLPIGSSWASTNVQRLVNFTNSGNISIPGVGQYGTDRSNPYNHIINSGTNTAASQLVRARNFVNSGSFIASSALVQINAGTARIEGPRVLIDTDIRPNLVFTNIGQTNFVVVTNGFTTNITYSSLGAHVQSYSDLQITAGSLSVSNSLLAAGGNSPSFFFPGRLLLTVTNRFSDAGTEAPNFWNCSGFELRRRPTAGGDLLGTRLVSTVGINQLKTHVWAAQDVGAVASGFTNNLALGILGLNISTNNGRAQFRSASGRQALYVDYIELYNDATNFNRTIAINNNFTIYFANANVPVSKLDGAVNGRFRWVSSFAGPNSSTNITYPSGNTYTFNIALVQNTDLDSDGDGIPNADDPTPIYVAEDAQLAVALLNKVSPPRAMLSWNALAFSTNTVEFKDSANGGTWRVLTNYVHGPFTAPAQVYDPITGAAPTRVYRLRVSPAPNP